MNPREKASDWQSDQPALILQRRRERLEMAAIAAGHYHPEPIAHRRLLREVEL